MARATPMWGQGESRQISRASARNEGNCRRLQTRIFKQENNWIYLWHLLGSSVSVYEIFAIKMCMTFNLNVRMVKVKCKYVNRKLIHDFLFDGNTNVSCTCHHFQFRDICQKFDLENEGPCEWKEKRDLHHLSRNVSFYIGDFVPRI